jgi:2-amino-4-hydroxy-6-hydroxymethyldihydropteridine diphosphokinase
MNKVYLALGTNLGDKALNLLQAISYITKEIGNLSAVSSVYESEPWGFESVNEFLDMVVCVETLLPPEEILSITQSIEKKIGRDEKTNHSYQDRIIDIDIIVYDDMILNSDKLTIPHPLFHKRRFVLDPMNEIAPEFIHPVLNKKVSELISFTTFAT